MMSKFWLNYIVLPSLLIGFGSTVLTAQTTLNPDFEQEVSSIIDHSVPTLSCKQLYQKLETPSLVILDAREPAEYKVSHIKDAIQVGYEHFDANKLQTVLKSATLVIYCSVGYRSEKIGEQLKSLGYTSVYNLFGGIFEWSNRAYPLVNEQGEKTKKIHAYDKSWGKWIENGEKVY